MFSIIIPLYNKELSIRKTIQSALDQTFHNFEILVINDGSTDSSLSIVNEINDKRVKVITQSNKGVSAARNLGIKKANYEWIAFLDGDDLWEPNHLKQIVKMMSIFPNKYVYATSFKFSTNRKVYRHSRDKNIFLIENYFKEALKEPLLWTSITVVNKSCFENVGYFREILAHGEDLDLWIRLAKKYEIIKSSEITSTYRIDAENRTSLGRNVKRTHVYHIDIDSIKDPYEIIYHKKAIIERMVAYIKIRDIQNFNILRKKHSQIKLKTFLSYSSFLVIKKIVNKIF